MGYKWKATVEGSRSDNAIWHVGNRISWNCPQRVCNVVIERNDCECGIILAELLDKSVECIGGDASALDQIDNLNERDCLNIGRHAAGCCGVD